VALKSAGPGIAAAAAEARNVDTLGRRIDRQAKLSPAPFQALVAVYVGRECLGNALARGKAADASTATNSALGYSRRKAQLPASLRGEQ
jgi:hypothetical protein